VNPDWTESLFPEWEAIIHWFAGDFPAALASAQDAAARAVGELSKRRALGVVFAALVFIDLAELAATCGEADTTVEAAEALGAIARHVDRDLYDALAGMGSACCGDAGAARHAVDLLSATGCKAFHARALHDLGRCLLDEDRAEAVETLKRSAAAFESCGATWRREQVRELLRGLGARGRRAVTAGLGPSGLTPRERQVARLAAEGRTAREIGEHLFIGERTVETHLANVYAKLGVRSKIELARRASELTLNQ
jgi:DNA-binding CsgD family transcriptional regulator